MIGSVQAALTITETSVNLGTAGVGTTASGTFTLSNSVASSVSLTYTDISFSGSAGTFTGSVGGTTPATIAASSSATVNLKVAIPAAQAVGTYTGTLVVKDSADSTTNASLPVTVTVSNTHDVTVEGGEIVVDLDYDVLRDDDANITVSKAFTVKNTGAFTETVTLALSNLNAGVKNSALTETTFTLAAGASKSVTFSAAMPVTFDTGVSPLPSFGKLRVGFNSQTKDIDMKANAKTMLDIVKMEADVGEERDSSVDDGEKISKDASRSDKIILTFEVKNLFNDNYDEGDIEGVEVNVQIDENDEDEFGDSVDEDSDEFDVNAGDREQDVTVEFDVPDDAEDGTYTFVVTAKGEDGNGAEHTATMTFDLEVKLERDDVRITRVDLAPTSVECSRDVSMSVQVRNHGSRDQDDVMLQVDNAALGIDQDFEFELEESGGDDDARRQFSFTVGDTIAAGIHPIEVRVFIDGDELEDEERANLNVRSCALTTGTGSTGTGTTPGDSTTVVIQPGAGTTGQTSDAPTTGTTTPTDGDIVFDSEETPFTQSPLFWVVLALANVVVLAVIVFVVVKVLK